MKVIHNGPSNLNLGNFNRPVSIAVGEPLLPHIRNRQGQLNLNEDEIVRITNDKPRLFRKLDRDGVVTPKHMALPEMFEGSNFAYEKFDETFDGAPVIMRGKSHAKDVDEFSDLISFLASIKDDPSKNYVALQKPQRQFRTGSVTIIPALRSDEFPYGAVRSEISHGDMPEVALFAAAVCAEKFKLDFVTIEFTLEADAEGNELPEVTNVHTRMSEEDAEYIAEMIAHKLGIRKQRAKIQIPA